jgi:hypothetical protein
MGAGTGRNKTPPNEILLRYIHPYRERPGFHGDETRFGLGGPQATVSGCPDLILAFQMQ